MFKVGEKVSCVDGNCTPLVEGELYTIESIDKDRKMVSIKEIEGGDYFYFADRFSKIEDVENNVNHPSHYNKGIETIDYIESHDMNFNVGNVIKYVTRAKHKNNELEDLKKAQWYLQREIDRIQSK